MRLKNSHSENLPVALGMSKINGMDNQGFSQDENLSNGNSRFQNAPGHESCTNNNNNNNTYESVSIISGPATTDNNIPRSSPSISRINGSAFPGTDKRSFDLTGTKQPSLKTADSDPPHGKDTGAGDTVPTSSKKDDVKLKRSLNLWYCTSIMVAVTGHSSIFISPSQIMATSGSLGSALVIWLVGGLVNLGTALCFAELGTMNPTAGGPYNMAMSRFGPMLGFLLVWGYAILIAAPFWAFLSYTAALYIIRPIFPDCLPDDIVTAIRILGGWLMVSMVAINCVYMKYVTRFQTVLSSCKIIALLILIGAGIYNIIQGKVDYFEDMFEGTTQEPGKMALAFFYSTFSYGGWQVMTNMLEEMKNPARDAPLSNVISFVIVILNYIMTNAAYVTLMSPQEVIDSPAVALDFVDRLYGPLVIVISALVALTSIGALNGSIMGHSRLLLGGARKGQLPQILGMVHVKYLTPWPSIFVFTVLSLIMLFSGGVTDMMEFISLFSTILNVIVIVTLLNFRYSQPDRPRPYKNWIGLPIVALIIHASVLVLGIYQKPRKMGIALAILFSGLPVYLLGGYCKRNKDADINSTIDNWTAKAQALLMITKAKES